MRTLGSFFAVLGLITLAVAHFADRLGLGHYPGVGADQLLGMLFGAGMLGFGLILLLTPSDLPNLALPPESRFPVQRKTARRRSGFPALHHARHP